MPGALACTAQPAKRSLDITGSDPRLFNRDIIKICLLIIGSKTHHVGIDRWRNASSWGQIAEHNRDPAETKTVLRQTSEATAFVGAARAAGRVGVGSGARRRIWLPTVRHSTEVIPGKR